MLKMEPTWENTVVLDFWVLQDPGDEKKARDFLVTVEKFDFVPKKFGDEDPPKQNFDLRSTGKLIEAWVKHPGQLILERLGRRGFQALLHLSSAGKRPGLITFAVHDEYFRDDRGISKFLEFSEELYRIFRPFHGEISHRKDWENKTVIIKPMKMGGRIVNAESHEPVQPTKGLPGIFWANFFGPPFVDFYSKAKLQAAPGYVKKELFDGGYLILTSKSPLEYMKPEAKKMERNLTEYLGADTVF